MDHQLREGVGEFVGVVRQFLGRPTTHVDIGESLVDRVDERRGRIDRGDCDPSRQHMGGQRPRATPDVEDTRVGTDLREGREDLGERVGVSAHEAPVGVGRDDETHSSMLGRGVMGVTVVIRSYQ